MDQPGHPPMSPLPIPPKYGFGARPRTLPDPGSPGRGKLAVLAVVALIAIVAIFQQVGQSSAAQAAGQPPLAPGGAANPPPIAKQHEFVAKAGTKLFFFSEDPAKPTRSGETLARDIIATLRPAAEQSLHDHIRLAAVRGALESPEAAQAELDAIEKRLSELSRPEEDPEQEPAAERGPATEPGPASEQSPPEEPLESAAEGEDLEREARAQVARDLEILRRIYSGEQPTKEDAQRLEQRHGWFGRLAATQNLPRNDPARRAVIGGGGTLAAAFVLFGLLLLGVIIAGFVLFVLALVKATAGTLVSRFAPPLPGGSIAAETVAIFIAGFILFKLVTDVVASRYGDVTGLWFALTGQWGLAILIFYPLVRGVPAQQWFSMIGFHRGRGVLREIGAGIVGYLACLPLLLCGVLLTVIVIAIQAAIAQAQGKQPPSPQNPIIELAGGGAGPAAVFMLFFLASLWAPLVEEAIFRGALYRHLRGWWHWLPAGVATALAFGLMHGYPLLMLGPVICLGFGFALIREWRGSLIACMTAHCIHNAGTLLILLAIFRIIGL